MDAHPSGRLLLFPSIGVALGNRDASADAGSAEFGIEREPFATDPLSPALWSGVAGSGSVAEREPAR